MTPEARADAINEVRALIADLTDCYRPNRKRGPMYPGLLVSLDRTPVLASPVIPPGASGRRQPPKSRPPGSIDWPSTAQDIRSQAVAWDAFIRGSVVARAPRVSFMAISANADTCTSETLRLLRTDARKWVRSAAILVGYLDPVLDVPQLYRAPCFDCEAVAVHLVPLAMSGECYECGSEYDNARIRLLAREAGL